MPHVVSWVEPYRPYLEIATGTASLLAVITWIIAIPLILRNWWRGRGLRVEFNVMGIRAAAFLGGAAEQWALRTPAGDRRPTAATAAQAVRHAFDAQGNSRLKGKRILWVDDQPSTVDLEVRSFEELGATVRRQSDTSSALAALASETFDLVISDMGRPPDARAGYTLLAELRRQEELHHGGRRTPFLIYSTTKLPEHVDETYKRGAQGTTNDPEELLTMALAQI